MSRRVLVNDVATAREAAGLSQAQVAKKLGMHATEISKIERGRREPRISKALELARVIGCDVNDLYRIMEQRF